MESKTAKKGIVATIVFYVGLLVGVGLIVAGGVMLVKALLGFVNNLGAVVGGQEGASLDVNELVSQLVLPAGLLLGGFIVVMVFRYLLKRHRKKTRAEKQKQAEQPTPEMMMQWTTPVEAAKPADPMPTVQAAYPPEQTEQGWGCPICAAPIRQEYNMCPHCGTRLAWGRPLKKCVHCGEVLQEGWACCPTCGTAIETIRAQQKPQAGPRRCMYCGAELAEGQEICPVCNHKYVDKN